MTYNYQSLSDDELLFGYKNIVLYYESEVKNSPLGFKINTTKMTQYLLTNSIDLKQLKTSKIAKRFCDYGTKDIAFFIFSKVQVGKKKFADTPSLLYHLRNAFAHNNVEKKKINGEDYYCFIDVRQKEYTLIGQIPVKLLKGFIQELKNTKVK